MVTDPGVFGSSSVVHPYLTLAHAYFLVEFLLRHNYLHIWPRHSFMMIALPNLVRLVVCTVKSINKFDICDCEFYCSSSAYVNHFFFFVSLCLPLYFYFLF
jgi:hypothetical protein